MRDLVLIQYNMQKSDKNAIPFFVRREAQDADFILVQEPWENPHKKATVKAHNFWEVHHTNENQRFRVASYVNKRLDLNAWDVIRLEKDIITIKLQTGDTPIFIHNVYSEPAASHATVDFDTPVHNLAEVLAKTGEHIMMGDLNLHHPMWCGPRNPQTHALASTLINSTQTAGLTLATKPKVITRAFNGSESTIDLCFLSAIMQQRLLQCVVRPDLNTGSDHFPIFVRISTEAPILPKPPKRVWRDFDSKLIKRVMKTLVMPGPDLSPEAIEEYVCYC